MTAEGSLHALLQERMAEAGVRSQAALTVMAGQRDPYRMEKYRAEAEWLAAAMVKIPHRPVHVRGLHYAAIGTVKPDGNPYTNTVENSEWLGDRPAKAARWLGLVGWDEIVDHKNDPPQVKLWTPPEPRPRVLYAQAEIAFPEDPKPVVDLNDFRGSQRHKLTLFAEKSAVAPVVEPIAERYEIDTYIGAGEISDSHLYEMAKVAAEDGRPMVVFTLCDADPAGYWMPATIAYKLHAFRDGWFPELEFEVHPVGFLPEQVHAINANGIPLPSSPLEEGERRAGAWEQTFGIEQVELDAIATLRPEVLEEIVLSGVEPFYDRGLDGRVDARRLTWETDAQAAFDEQVGPDFLAELRREAEERLEGLREEVDALNDALWIDLDGIRLPPMPAIPAPELNGTPSPLVGSEMDFAEFVHTLKQRGTYGRKRP
jgi:hypothetical protein